MNKDFWERIERLEKLAGKATQEEWYTEYPQRYNIEFRAAVNPATVLEMIAVFKGRLSFLEHELVEKDIELENTKTELKRLEKEVDWLAMSCQNVRRFPTMNGKPEDDWTAYKWREAARKAVSEADNA